MSEQVHTLIGAYALNAVDDNERALIDQHVTECESCAADLFELRATAARLADDAAVEPPRQLRRKVMDEVRHTRQDPPPESASMVEEVLQPKQIRPWRRVLVTAAVAVVMALAGGAATFAIMNQQVDSQRSQAAQVESVLSAPDAQLERQKAEGGGIVSVVSSATQNRAVVALSGLADLGTDDAYQLWTVDANGANSAGVLQPGHNSATKLVSGINGAEVLGVTHEPAGGSSKPTLPMVAGVELKA